MYLGLWPRRAGRRRSQGLLVVYPRLGNERSALAKAFDAVRPGFALASPSRCASALQFVAHPKVQQLLAALWYEGLPGFRRKGPAGKARDLALIALLFPLYCVVYMVAPDSRLGRHVRKPFIKFLLHASSYLFFLRESDRHDPAPAQSITKYFEHM